MVSLNSTCSGLNTSVTCDPQVSPSNSNPNSNLLRPVSDVAFHVWILSRRFFSSPQNFNSSDYPECPAASCIFFKYNDEGLFQRNIFNLQLYNVFAFLWCVNFVIALGQCTLAGAFSSYYWAFSKPDDIPTFPLSASFVRSLRWVSAPSSAS